MANPENLFPCHKHSYEETIHCNSRPHATYSGDIWHFGDWHILHDRRLAIAMRRLNKKSMFEHKSEKLVPLAVFLRRMAFSFLLLLTVLIVALGLGVLGYHEFAGLSWVDSMLNASMILTGMGPIAPMTTTSAKFFASTYALFSGVVFLSSVGLLLAPVLHRILHTFHLDESDQKEEDTNKKKS